MNVLGSCFCDGLEIYPTAGGFVTGWCWLPLPLNARTVVAGTSPLPWNIGLAWRPTDLSHTALPCSGLELFLQSLAMRGITWHRGFVKVRMPWQHRSSCQAAVHSFGLCWKFAVCLAVLWALASQRSAKLSLLKQCWLWVFQSLPFKAFFFSPFLLADTNLIGSD